MDHARARVWMTLVLLALGACAGPQQSAVTNRPDGEGYAGVDELLVTIRVLADGTNWFDAVVPHKHERAWVEIRYLGLNSAGRAVFARHDVDALAGAPVPPRAEPAAVVLDTDAGASAAAMPADTREIVVDLRVARQIRIQGKIIEILEASASGVVFRLY
ncbi:exported hypothetical protein [Burkholderiales bacterium]|nr:exported hypothetical protein [Burkholderiales bacterium]